MMKTTTIRMDDNLKREVTEMLDSLGLSFSSYVTMASKQLVTQRRIPFEVILPPEVPNEETRRAMVLAEAKEFGLIPDDAPAFANADDAMAFLEA